MADDKPTREATPSGDERIAALERRAEFTDRWIEQRWQALRALLQGTPYEKPAIEIMANGKALTAVQGASTAPAVEALTRCPSHSPPIQCSLEPDHEGYHKLIEHGRMVATWDDEE